MNDEERRHWSDTMVAWCRKEALLGRTRGLPIPFGTLIPEESRYGLELVEADVFARLREPGQVEGLGDCPGIIGKITRRMHDWYFLVESLLDQLPPDEVRAPPPNLVTGMPCLTMPLLCTVAVQAKLGEYSKEPLSDADLAELIRVIFEAEFPDLELAADSLRRTIAEVRRLVRDYTLLQLHGLQPGLQ